MASMPLIRGLVWLAGVALIVVGIICLWMSDAMLQAWWQGTLQAFGIGLVVGGVVDVLMITALTTHGMQQAAMMRREDNNRQALDILMRAEKEGLTSELVATAKDLIGHSEDQIDPKLREMLRLLRYPSGPPSRARGAGAQRARRRGLPLAGLVRGSAQGRRHRYSGRDERREDA
jgi:hypothetical protein